MDNESTVSHQEKINELSRNILIATSSLIPGVGGVLSFFLDKYLPNTIEKRRDDFLLALSNDMKTLPSEIIEKLSTDETFHSIVLKVFRAVVQEGKEIKISAFRNILINSALYTPKVDEREFYIKLLTELTTDQIRILHLFFLRDVKEYIHFTDVNKYIAKNWLDVDESYRFALVTELIRYGLITSSQRTQKTNGSGHHLSAFGGRFIYYIFQPNEHIVDDAT